MREIKNSELFRAMKLIDNYAQEGNPVAEGWEDWSDQMIVLFAARIAYAAELKEN